MIKRPQIRLFLSSIVLIAGTAQAAPQVAPNSGCPGPEYQQFAFWVGDWDVVSAANGQTAGQSHVERLAEGCIVFENWAGSKGGTGNSINVYDQADGKWHQTWVDSTGDQVQYVGTWTGSKLEFKADDMSTPQKVRVILTMTFEPLSNGNVRQSGTLSSDGGQTFQPSFDLIYKRRKK
jgi:hypothetical protein